MSTQLGTSYRVMDKMTPAKVNAVRQKNIADHIRLLEKRYSKTGCGEILAILEARLIQRIAQAKTYGPQWLDRRVEEARRDGFQTK